MSYRKGDVVKLYKQLLYLGKSYPTGAEQFNFKLKKAFAGQKDLTEAKEIDSAIGKGEFIVKELEALYFLKKYRSMKQRYYE